MLIFVARLVWLSIINYYTVCVWGWVGVCVWVWGVCVGVGCGGVCGGVCVCLGGRGVLEWSVGLCGVWLCGVWARCYFEVAGNRNMVGKLVKGCRMGCSHKVSLWCVSLFINTRFPFFILE